MSCRIFHWLNEQKYMFWDWLSFIRASSPSLAGSSVQQNLSFKSIIATCTLAVVSPATVQCRISQVFISFKTYKCCSHLSNKWGDSLIDFVKNFTLLAKTPLPHLLISFQPPSFLHDIILDFSSLLFYSLWLSWFVPQTHRVRLFHFEFNSKYVLQEM